MSDDNGPHRKNWLFPSGMPDWDALDRETKWELVGCVILLVITLSMAAAINLYAP
jgi:hypothetical protein